MVKTLLKTLNERPVAFHPIYIRITWSIASWYLLSQILYWFYKQGWEFYKKDEDWINELHLWVKELRNAKKKLKDLSLIKIKLRWNPATSHYSINEEILISLLTKINKKPPAQKDNQDTPKGHNKIRPKGQTKNAQKDNQDMPKGTNYIYKDTEITTETTTESNNKLLGQSPEASILDNKKDKNIEDQKITKTPSDELIEELENEWENGEYWDEKINWVLSYLSKKVWVDEFKETTKRQRIYAKHVLSFIDKKGKDEFIKRLKGILKTEFKSQNSNSIKYLYSEIKSFIHSPSSNQSNLIEELIKKLPGNTPDRKKTDIRTQARTWQENNKEKTMNSSTASQIVDKIINNKWSNENN